MTRLLPPLLGLPLALAVLAGCGDSTPVVDRAKLEKEISRQLEASVGQAPDDISCPRDLKGKVGQKMRCTLTAGADELGVTVTVTSVKDERVKFDAEVDQMDEGER